MNRPKIGWLVAGFMVSGISACGAWPTGGDNIQSSSKSREVANASAHHVVAAKKTPPKRNVKQTGVKNVSLPTNVAVADISPIKASRKDPARLTTKQVIQRVALPDYLQPSQDQRQSHSDLNTEKTDISIAPNQAIGAADPTYKHLWESSQTLQWAKDLEGKVQVETNDADLPKSIQQEPSLDAQLAYARGMDAWLSGQFADAKKAFEEALRLEPDNVAILRQLGWVNTVIGNKVVGATYFKKVLAIQPEDIIAMYLVGRHELETGKYDYAIASLGRVYQKLEAGIKGIDQSVLPLSQFFLAGALRQGGYINAASEMLEGYLMREIRMNGSSIHGRELIYQNRQIGLHWLLAGDMRNQLGDPKAAVAMYEQAITSGIKRNEKVQLRLTYSKLRLDDSKGAMIEVGRLLQNATDHHITKQIVSWMLEQGAKRDDLFNHLLNIYDSAAEKNEQLAIVISDVSNDERGKLLLVEHLRQNPKHNNAYEHLFKQWVFADHDSLDQVRKEIQIREGLFICLDLMQRDATSAGEYARSFLRYTKDLPTVERIIESMSDLEQSRAEVQVMFGLSKAARLLLPEASVAFENAFKRNPDMLIARLELTKMMLVMKRYDRAAELLQGIDESKRFDTDIVRLYAKMQEQQDKLQLALEEYQLAIDNDNNDVEMLLGKADIQIKMKLVKPCEQTLLDAISLYPKEEQLYAAILKLYDTRSLELGDMQRRYNSVLNRLMGLLPNSRLAKIKRGEIMFARGEYVACEKAFNELLAEYPEDFEIMGRLMQTYTKSNQQDKATNFIESQIKKQPTNASAMKLAINYFQSIRDMEKVFTYSEQLIMLEPTGPTRELQLASLYVSWQRDLDAAAVLSRLIKDKQLQQPHTIAGMLWSALHRAEMDEQGDREIRDAMKRFPDHSADIGFQWALLVDSVGNRDKSERIMLEVIDKHPNYAPANNQLGYAWVVRGERLEQAKVMIERAVQVAPENGAYMDSLGWACYKLGDYPNAVKWLERATNTESGESPVILSHLGDAYWALGKRGNAVRTWEKARLMMENSPEKFAAGRDPELAGLRENLAEKILKAGE